MVDEIEKPALKQEKRKVRKVTTGAWWKSTHSAEAASKKTASAQSNTTRAATQGPAHEENEHERGLRTASQDMPTISVQPAVKVEGSNPISIPENAIQEQIQEKTAGAGQRPKRPRRPRTRRKKEEQKGEDKATGIQEGGAEGGSPAVASTSGPQEGITPDAPHSASDTLLEEQDNAFAEQQPAGEEPKKSTRRSRSKRKKGERKSGGEEQETAEATAEEGSERQPKQEDAEKKVIKLLINAEEPEECRIALVENGRLESFHVNTVVQERTKNNIYKGRIVSIEPNLQAAFVDIGTGRNGFLPFNDIHPEYYRHDVAEPYRTLIREQQWKKLKIENVVSRGQEVLVQVVKEVTGNKGANMTTFLSLPGRFLVLMPGSDSAGISRKISGDGRRSELREMVDGLSIPEGIGYIVRTASAEITKAGLEQDLASLIELWGEIRQRGQESPVPSLVYAEQDTVVRFLRDYFVPDIGEIIVDTQDSYEQVSQFVATLPARQNKIQVRLHRGVRPIFNQHNLEGQIESIYQPQVQLPSGGSIVINPTEALVAIDVNSGRTSQKGDFDKSIFLANMEAADELARQLRLRDLGGLIVVDFIDMRNKTHIRDVERQVKQAMKRDKAKVDISRISRFGLMQISRQKMGAPIERGSYHRCEHCEGRGVVRSVETLALYYLRRIQTGVSRKKIRLVEARLPLEVGQYLLNRKRAELMELEAKHQASIDIMPCPEMKRGENKIDFLA